MKANYKKMLSLAALVLAMGVTTLSGKALASSVSQNDTQSEVKEWEYVENSAVVSEDEKTAKITLKVKDGEETKDLTVDIDKHTDNPAYDAEKKCQDFERTYFTVVVKELGEGKFVTIGPVAKEAKDSDHTWETDYYVETGLSDNKGKATVKADCETKGYARVDQVCAVCGKRKEGTTFAETNALGHDYEFTFVSSTGVSKDSKGNVLDADGKVVELEVKDGTIVAATKAKLENPDVAGSYVVKAVCKNDASHFINNVTITVKPAVETVNDTVIRFENLKNVKVTLDNSSVKATDAEVTGTYAKPDLSKIKVTLISCKTAGSYSVVEYAKDDTAFKEKLSKEDKTIAAGTHSPAEAVPDESTRTSNVSFEDKDGKRVAVNNTCTRTGSYKAVVYCENDDCDLKNKVISTTTVVVDKADHKDAMRIKGVGSVTKEENVTATCQKDGTCDQVEYCSICGEEISRKTGVFCAKKDHVELDPEIVEGEAATAHHPGYYYSVVKCKWGGEEIRRTKVTTPATDPNKFEWKYELKWSDPTATYSDRYTDIEYISADAKPVVELVMVPTDSDLSSAEKTAMTQRFPVEVEEVTAEAVAGDACHMQKKTFKATVDSTYKYKVAPTYTNGKITASSKTATNNDKEANLNEAVKTEETKTYNVKQSNFKGHKWSEAERVVVEEPTTEKEGKAAYRRTCSVCGETMDDYYEKIDKLPTKEEPTETDPTDPTEEVKPDPEEKISIKGAEITGTATFRGEYFNVPFTVTLDGKQLEENTDFVLTNARKNNFRTVGSHTIKIAGIGKYTGTAKGKLTITKANQNIKISKTKKTFKASTLKKKAASFITTITNAHGKLSYKTSSKKITFKKVAVGTYKVTAKKGTKAGKYTITINFATSKSYNAAKKTITVTVK